MKPSTLLNARRSLVVVALLAGGAAFPGLLTGCQSASKDTGSMGIVNQRCPMMPNCGHAPSAANSVVHNNQRVGFCCAGCVGEWNQLSNADKDAKLAAVK